MTEREHIGEAVGAKGVLVGERSPTLRLFALASVLLVGLAVALGGALSAAHAAGLFKFAQHKVPTADSEPRYVTPGSDGNLWFTEGAEFFTPNDDPDTGGAFHNQIGRITPAGEITEFRVEGCQCFLNDIVQGPNDVLYYTSNNQGLGRITTQGEVLPEVMPGNFSALGGGVAAHGDDVWYADFNNDSLWRYDVPSGQFTQFEVPTPPGDVAVADNGTVWYTADNTIGRLDPASGATTETPVPAQPTKLAIATDGKVWYTERIADHIGRLDPESDQLSRFPTLTPDAGPQDITAAPDGTLWFTQANAGNAAQITADGVITEAGRTSKDPAGTLENALGITMGPDGESVWFAKPADNKIAALTPR